MMRSIKSSWYYLFTACILLWNDVCLSNESTKKNVYTLTLEGISKEDIDSSSILQNSLQSSLAIVLNIPVSTIGKPDTATMGRIDLPSNSIFNYFSSQTESEVIISCCSLIFHTQLCYDCVVPSYNIHRLG